MKKALAIIAYARFDYFELVFPSILNQQIDGKSVADIYDVFIFQDGLWASESEDNQRGHQKIRRFADDLPDGFGVISQEKNLGVALHFDFIERFLFVEKQYDFVVFLEDDLILAPGYFAAMDSMAEKFKDDPRVGMISAHPGNPRVAIAEQREYHEKFAAMGHNWGFGLTRQFWERRQPFVDCYLDLIRDIPYRKRNEKIIFEWLRRVGFKPNASSQDYMKTCATIALGAVKLSTFPNFGLPIGRTGLHSNPAIFKRNGFDRTVIFDGELPEISDLDDQQFMTIYRQGADEVGKSAVAETNETRLLAALEWQKRLASNEFHPKNIIQDIPDIPSTPMPNSPWSSTDIPEVPHMEKEGIALLSEKLSTAAIYLEYGAGGSTVFAAANGCAEIHTVESDEAFLSAVRVRVAELGGSTNLYTHYVDIGPTKEWGQPIDRSCATKWPRYASAVWGDLRSQDTRPDLILIDGRFRAACFMVSAMLAKPGTTILFDHYFDRPHYHVVEKYIKPRARAGRMAEFVVDLPIKANEMVVDLIGVISDPA